MRGTVKIGQRDVDMLANAASPFIYKKIFHKDFLMTVGTNYVDANGKQQTDVDTSAITEMDNDTPINTDRPQEEIHAPEGAGHTGDKATNLERYE